MNRTAYFLVAIILGFVAYWWWTVRWLLYFGNAVGKDSTGRSFYDASFIAILVVWGILLLGILWGIWRCLKQAFRPPRMDSSPRVSEPPQVQKTPDGATPDERLAHLVKKP
jgi:ABC-type nickel/cobalt efflux system permease component RcnA